MQSVPGLVASIEATKELPLLYPNNVRCRMLEVIREFLIGQGCGGRGRGLYTFTVFSMFSSIHHKMPEIFPDVAVVGAPLETNLKCWSLRQNARDLGTTLSFSFT